MQYLQANLSVLRGRQPEIARLLENTTRSQDAELLHSPLGLPVHRYGGKLLHSLRDPVREAGLWASRGGPPTPVVFGFGDGYHLEACLGSAGNGNGRLTVIEPEARLLRAVFEDRDLTGLLPRVKLLVGGSPAESAQALTGCEAPPRVHPPSENLHTRFLEAFRALWRYQRRGPGPLRIAVVGPVYGGSYPVACHVCQALNTLGHQVEFLDMTDFHAGYRKLTAWDERGGLAVDFEGVLSRLIERRIRDLRPDLVLFLAQAPVQEESLRRLRGEGIRVAFWFVEDFRRMSYWRRLAPCTDAFFMIQRDGQQEVRAAGAPLVRYLPMAASEETHRPLALSQEERRRFGSDVSFVGAGYFNRRRFLSRLTGLDLKIWGNDWDDPPRSLVPYLQEGSRRVETEEIVKIFNSAGVNLNIHSSTHHEEVDPHGDFVNPRTFEIAACAAFQLVDSRSLMGELFASEEIATFADFREARDMTGHYLAHPEERGGLARAARGRVLAEHTYGLRLQEMLGVLLEQGLLEPRPERRTARQWSEEATDPELKAWFCRFEPEESLDLEKMIAGIRGRQNLNETDRLLLTLSAFKEEAQCRRSC